MEKGVKGFMDPRERYHIVCFIRCGGARCSVLYLVSFYIICLLLIISLFSPGPIILASSCLASFLIMNPPLSFRQPVHPSCMYNTLAYSVVYIAQPTFAHLVFGDEPVSLPRSLSYHTARRSHPLRYPSFFKWCFCCLFNKSFSLNSLPPRPLDRLIVYCLLKVI